MTPDGPPAAASGALARLEPVRCVRTGELEVGYFEAGPDDGEAVLLLHGFPYDIHSYVDVIPLLAAAGRRVIVPYLRGHGPTRFVDAAAPRSGQQAAIGAGVISLLDALGIRRAIFAGYDWGGRAACVAAALWPERCTGVVSVNGYLIQDIRTAMTPIQPDREAGLWYFFYFLTERGRAGLTANRREIAKVIWTRNSPAWTFDDATLERAVVAFDNPDYVDVVCTPTATASDARRVTRRTRRLSKDWPPCRRSRSRPSPWTAWQTATSPRLTVPPPHITSPRRAATTRCRTRATTCPRKHQTHSPTRSWSWPPSDHQPPHSPPRSRRSS
jgi:pimeloyl-ACP methyl ester carboxylesterase